MYLKTKPHKYCDILVHHTPKIHSYEVIGIILQDKSSKSIIIAVFLHLNLQAITVTK